MPKFDALSEKVTKQIEEAQKSNIPFKYAFLNENVIRRKADKKDDSTVWRPSFVRDIDKILYSPYYNRYTGKKWGDSHNYHLTLDSGALGYELCAKLIAEAAKAEAEYVPSTFLQSVQAMQNEKAENENAVEEANDNNGLNSSN